MPTYLTPGVYFETVDASRPGVTAVRTDIAAFTGIAERGPLHTPTVVRSWEQFQSVFGTCIPNGFLAYAAKAFFENGGQTCYIVRVAAGPISIITDPLAAQPVEGLASLVLTVDGFAAGAAVTVTQWPRTKTSAAPQPADRASSLVVRTNGFPAGSLVTVTQGPLVTHRRVLWADTAVGRLGWETPLDRGYDLGQAIDFSTIQQADHLLQEVDAGSRRLVWTRSLEAAFDLAQPLQFDTGAAQATAELWDARGLPTLRIAATSPGAWGNALVVRVARSSPVATRTTGVQPAEGAASRVETLTGFPVGSLVKLFQPSAPAPLVSYRIVSDVDPLRKLLVWDAPLPPGYDLAQPIALETLEFSLTVLLNGRVQEIFSRLSLIEGHPRYVAAAITPTTSHWVTVTDTQADAPAVTPWPDRLPDPAALNLRNGQICLAAGRDGIAAIQPLDVTGDLGSDTKWGLRTLEEVDEVAIVAMPDVLIRPRPAVEYAPQPIPPVDPCCPGPTVPPIAAALGPKIVEAAPVFTLDEVFAIQQALVAHCEGQHDRIAVLDAPLVFEAGDTLNLDTIQSWRLRFDSKHAALYYPWLLVYDPLQLDGQVIRPVPPSGHVTGVYAATDIAIGVHKAPANVELRWAQALTIDVDAESQGLLNPQGINCLRVFPGRGLRVYGARTVSSDADWRYVNVRRLLLMIEKAVDIAIQWAVFEPNDFYLRQAVTLSITSFLTALWERGALAGVSADDAFFVKCDASNNPPDLADVGQLVAEVGAAPTIPAEFVIFRVGRTENTLQITEP